MNLIHLNLKKISFYAGIAVLIALVLIGSFYFGYSRGQENPKRIEIVNVTNTEHKDEIGINFGVFWETWDLLKKEHLKGGETKDQDLIYGAIRGLVNSLDDPHTIFLSAEDSKRFEEDVNGSFGGIGAEIGLKNNQLVVIAPLKNTPAEKAGLLPGDKILAIDNQGTDGIDVNGAVKKIRGEPGIMVTLTVFRESWERPKDIKITRAIIEVPTLEWNYVGKETAEKLANNAVKDIIEAGDKKIAHLKLFTFNQNAPTVFYKAALRVLFGKMDGIILDLRNNPGGFLEVAANLSGWFLHKGDTIVKERFKNGEEVVFRANGNEALVSIPTVILVNKGSASASEILAGTLRANRKIKLIGTNTFGKGTVQELRALSDDSKIKLTIANWVFPDGMIIGEDGLKPDAAVEIQEADAKNNKDPQLEKAIEILLEEIEKATSD